MEPKFISLKTIGFPRLLKIHILEYPFRRYCHNNRGKPLRTTGRGKIHGTIKKVSKVGLCQEFYRTFYSFLWIRYYLILCVIQHHNTSCNICNIVTTVFVTRFNSDKVKSYHFFNLTKFVFAKSLLVLCGWFVVAHKQQFDVVTLLVTW